MFPLFAVMSAESATTDPLIPIEFQDKEVAEQKTQIIFVAIALSWNWSMNPAFCIVKLDPETTMTIALGLLTFCNEKVLTPDKVDADVAKTSRAPALFEPEKVTLPPEFETNFAFEGAGQNEATKDCKPLTIELYPIAD